jgi:hypothetical protein
MWTDHRKQQKMINIWITRFLSPSPHPWDDERMQRWEAQLCAISISASHHVILSSAIKSALMFLLWELQIKSIWPKFRTTQTSHKAAAHSRHQHDKKKWKVRVWCLPSGTMVLLLEAKHHHPLRRAGTPVWCSESANMLTGLSTASYA